MVRSVEIGAPGMVEILGYLRLTIYDLRLTARELRAKACGPFPVVRIGHPADAAFALPS